jgi:hypothetical protein
MVAIVSAVEPCTPRACQDSNLYDGLLTKENLWPLIHECINNSQNSAYLFWLSRNNLLFQDFVNVLYNYTFKTRCLISINSGIK